MHKEEEYKKYFNLTCAIMDRVDSSVDYLNEHSDYPKTEMDFWIFLMVSCVINDAVPRFFEYVDKTFKEEQECKFFKSTCERNNVRNVRGNETGAFPTDEKFFEYIRSLVFAHPFQTDHSKVVPNGKVFFSPFVLVNRSCFYGEGEDGDVGIRIYSNEIGDVDCIWLPFEDLKAYVKYRFEKLTLITNWISSQYDRLLNKWKLRKVDRSLPSPQLLLDVISICEERKMDSCEDLKDLYDFMTCPLSNKENEGIVNIYRQALVSFLPQLCDAVDNVDEESIYTLPDKYLFPTDFKCDMMSWKYHVTNVQVKKRFAGEIDAKVLANATECWGWVKIDVENMYLDEIRLLISAACYLESQKQKGSV